MKEDLEPLEVTPFNPFEKWTDEHIVLFLVNGFYEEEERVFDRYCEFLSEVRSPAAALRLLAQVLRRVDQRSGAAGCRRPSAGQTVTEPAP